MRLELAPRAVRDAERCAAWWRDSRAAARTLFEHKLRAALDRIRNTSLLGGIYEVVSGLWECRRALMTETRLPRLLTYRVVSSDLVRVLAIWSAVRGRVPRL